MIYHYSKYGKNYRKCYNELYGETVKRYSELHAILKRSGIKLLWWRIFSDDFFGNGSIIDRYSAIKKEAEEQGVFLAVVINREVNEIFDELERKQNDIS